jgi:ABC-type glutathione transport system ATPase component
VLLAAEHLTKTFVHRRGWLGRAAATGAARPALADASLSVERGESVGIVGESGSGKSTLARCLAFLERPDAGRVLFDGIDLARRGRRELRLLRRRIQVVFQDPYSSLNPRLTVGSALREVLRVHDLVPREQIARRVEVLLDQVGLPAHAVDRYPSDFSGGQRQRICIARALAAGPDVLIADEPVSALDVSIQAQVMNLLGQLQREFGLAYIFIAHDLSVVRHVAQRVAVMTHGEIVEMGETARVFDEPQHDYTRRLLGSVLDPDPDRPRL